MVLIDILYIKGRKGTNSFGAQLVISETQYLDNNSILQMTINSLVLFTLEC
jgi:hypothetical protein